MSMSTRLMTSMNRWLRVICLRQFVSLATMVAAAATTATANDNDDTDDGNNDSDGDGGLSSTEFLNALEKVSWWILSRKTPDVWFREADNNGDDTLSMKEFGHICTSGNHINNVFKRADLDDSGDLSLRETTTYIRSITHGKQNNRKSRQRKDQATTQSAS